MSDRKCFITNSEPRTSDTTDLQRDLTIIAQRSIFVFLYILSEVAINREGVKQSKGRDDIYSKI